MASILFRATQLLSLVAILEGGRIKKEGTEGATLTATNGEATPLEVVVPIKVEAKSGYAHCEEGADMDEETCKVKWANSDDWEYVDGACCTRSQKVTCNTLMDPVTCEKGWGKYLGNGKCCYSKYAHCAQDADEDKCEGDGWKYVDARTCCTTTEEVHCKGLMDPVTCKKDWQGKYLGKGKCCYSKYAHCKTLMDPVTCKKEQGEYLGSGKCCYSKTESKTESKYARCEEDADEDKCQGDGWKYVGARKCCTTSPEVHCKGLMDPVTCKKDWQGTYLGKGKCCYSKGSP